MSSSAQRPTAVVPAVASSFIGRTVELAELAELTARERLVTLVGPGGCGKTRLATECVRGGLIPLLGFVELAAAGEQTDLPSAVLVACGLREEPGREPLDLLHDRLGREEGLLVLDNCEHLRAAIAELVADLLRNCPPLRVLATSRVTVGLTGETVLPLAGLDPTGDGVELLLERARHVQPDLPHGPTTEAAATEICSLADGLPLAIELAAAHARTLPLTGIRDGMADRMHFLAARGAGMARHSSLAASLDWSADLVGDDARRALAALSVVDGRFPLEVAIAVTGGDRDAVEILVDHSLVQFDAVDGRYVLLETVREYASGLLAASSGNDAAFTRLLEWAASFAREVRGGLERAEPDALRRVGQADAAVSSALDRVLETGRGLTTAAGVAVDLAFGWSLRGRCGEGLAKVQRLTALLIPTPPALLWAHAFLAVYSGDLENGFGIAAAAAEQAGEDGRTAARALILTGMVQAFVDPAGAEPVLTAAVGLARAAGDDWGEVEASQVVAYTHLFRGQLTDALAAADAVLPALNRLGHGQLRAWDAGIRAEVAASRGAFAEAIAHGRAGFALATAVGEPVSAFGALLPLLRALVATGRRDDSREVLDRGLRFLDTHPGLGTQGSAVVATAIVASTDSPATALTAAQLALDAVSDLPSLAVEAAILLATARLRSGDADGARAASDIAAETAAMLGNPGAGIAAALVGAAANRARHEAASAAHPALTEAHALGMRPLVVDALALVAALARDAGRFPVAARLHGAGERLRAELGMRVSPLARLMGPDPGFLIEHAAAVAEGERLGQAGAVGYAARRRGRRRRPSVGWESLTPTEREVVALVARGRSNQDVAAQLLVSTGTVRTHLRSVYTKLGLTNRAELAAHATGRDL